MVPCFFFLFAYIFRCSYIYYWSLKKFLALERRMLCIFLFSLLFVCGESKDCQFQWPFSFRYYVLCIYCKAISKVQCIYIVEHNRHFVTFIFQSFPYPTPPPPPSFIYPIRSFVYSANIMRHLHGKCHRTDTLKCVWWFDLAFFN